MQPTINLLSRRSFMDRTFKAGLGVALSTLVDIPFVMKRALAEGTIGLGGKKLLFIFLRFGNDGLNTIVPVKDPTYVSTVNDATYGISSIRPNIVIPPDQLTDYSALGGCDSPEAGPNQATFFYPKAIRTGNGFAALHPSLKFLAPVYNAGDLSLIHRVGYPKQSRSHFDSQNYWETGNPNNNLSKDGIFYRTMLESGLTTTNALTGVSIQTSLPLLLRGSQAAMTNLSDPTRFNLKGVPNTTQGNAKADAAIRAAYAMPSASKFNRDLLGLQYENMSKTLSIFEQLDWTENGNVFRDPTVTDGDTGHALSGTGGYYLFPTTNAKNGGFNRTGGTTDTNKYVVPTSAYGFFNQLKAAAMILNNTDAVIAGTELGGFDTHSLQGSATGTHANLQRNIGWAIYALRKYFSTYGRDSVSGARVNWNDVVVVTLSEFGRTSKENTTTGTDHAEAGPMFVAGGAVKGYGKPGGTGVFGCHTSDSIPWITGPANQAGGVDGTMFGVSDTYLKRSVDYRSVLGKLIRDHLGATQNQLNRIVPGYTDSREKLQAGGTSTIDNTPIIGEPALV
jgi:uncharacterized protein (DUF1501 family)